MNWGGREWDIPKLRLLLEEIIPSQSAMDEYEVEHDVPRIGRRVMLLNACIVRYEKAHTNIPLGIEDITVQRNLERDKDDLLRQKDVLLDELQHRVANSLQIIASIIMMKAKSVESEETRRHLHDAHTRVISVAAVQEHLHASAGLGSMEKQPYSGPASSDITGRNCSPYAAHWTYDTCLGWHRPPPLEKCRVTRRSVPSLKEAAPWPNSQIGCCEHSPARTGGQSGTCISAMAGFVSSGRTNCLPEPGPPR